ncbi:efflux transporter periplasmic adaptor subunit [Thiomicrospira sp. WB1]|nr:efflux transporter periplasmic adaptor subunit [Thiomicrospira sp. WB1]
MDLVQKKLETTQETPVISGQSGGTDSAKQAFSVRTQRIERTPLWKYIETFGQVQADQTRLRHVHPLTEGWIYDLQIRADGDRVTAEQPLFWIYSTELLAAQQDYLLALQRQSSGQSGARSVVQAAKSRLRHLGMAEKTLRTLTQKRAVIQRVPYLAPQSGVVQKLRVQEGMYVSPQVEMFQIVDLSQVWVQAQVLPLHQAWLKNGLTVEVSTAAYPGQHWEGRIDYIEPELDPVTQAKSARIVLSNEQEQLAPNMAADVVIYGGPKRNVLAVPLEAVIDDGRQARVVTRLESGGFQVKPVDTGMQTQGWVEILSGLNEGDDVVVSGQFLIDSESRIQSNLNRMNEVSEDAEQEAITPMDHQSSEGENGQEVTHDH